MIWFLRAIRAEQAAVLGLLTGGLSGLLHGHLMPVPSLAGGNLAPVPIVAVVTLAVAVGTLRSWEGLPPDLAAVAAKPIVAFWFCAALGVALIATLAALATGGLGSALEVSRNSLGLVGLSALAWRFGGRGLAVALPVCYLIVAFLFGRRHGPGGVQPWAWILHDGGDVLSWALSLAVWAAGMSSLRGIPVLRVTRSE